MVQHNRIGSFQDGITVILVVAGKVPGQKYHFEVDSKEEQRHYEIPLAGPTVSASAFTRYTIVIDDV